MPYSRRILLDTCKMESTARNTLRNLLFCAADCFVAVVTGFTYIRQGVCSEIEKGREQTRSRISFASLSCLNQTVTANPVPNVPHMQYRRRLELLNCEGFGLTGWRELPQKTLRVGSPSNNSKSHISTMLQLLSLVSEIKLLFVRDYNGEDIEPNLFKEEYQPAPKNKWEKHLPCCRR